MKINFWGAAEQVTGSKYCIEHENTRILVDCGLFQGPKEIRKRNWDDFPINPAKIDAIVLTHAHLDHTGYIPVLIKRGFTGKIYCSRATYALCQILLKDSGFLQEEYAKRVNEFGHSTHKPALALYNEQDAEKSLQFFQSVDYGTTLQLGSLQVTIIHSGHILGGSFIIVFDGKKTLTFSGDLGRPDQFIMKAPLHIKQTDFLVLESTYGDRLHAPENFVKELEKIVHETITKNGMLLIPAFAVGRAQILMYALYQLRQANKIPPIPIFLDSPMAIRVTNLYCDFKKEHKLPADICSQVFDIANFVKAVSDSKHLDHMKGPAIIIAGSGMVDGGRILHHLIRYISDPKTTILFVGYQAQGTKGRLLIDDSPEIKLYGRWYKVRATIRQVESLSAHADYNEILEWLTGFEKAPQKVFLTHGDVESGQALKEKIEERFGWPVVIPKYLESFELD